MAKQALKVKVQHAMQLSLFNKIIEASEAHKNEYKAKIEKCDLEIAIQARNIGELIKKLGMDKINVETHWIQDQDNEELAIMLDKDNRPIMIDVPDPIAPPDSTPTPPEPKSETN